MEKFTVTTLVTSPLPLVTTLVTPIHLVTRLGGGYHPGYHPGERAVQEESGLKKEISAKPHPWAGFDQCAPL